ncbi:MAG: DUF6340 family protein [Cytophagaceae bacterium]
MRKCTYTEYYLRENTIYMSGNQIKTSGLLANFLVLVFASVFQFSCSSTNYLTLSVAEPAPAYLPVSIKRIGIIDQTLPHDQTKNLDNLDKVLTAEGKNLDKDGAEEAVKALAVEIGKNPQFNMVKIISNADIRSPGMGIFPAPLKWQTVEQICKDNQVEALFVLSFYDTDTKIDYAVIPVELTGPLGVKIPGAEHQATIRTVIKTGWRIYDMPNRMIRDEFVVHENLVQSARGLTPVQAVQAIMGRKEAVMQISRQLGQRYSYRIQPFYVRVRRNYFVRGTDNFRVAMRRAQTGNWNGAAELWNREVNNPKAKVAGRATYNMAIISEINGDLNAAIDWASRSYSDYNNKLALDYLKILRHRMAKNEQIRRETQE